MLCKFCVSIMNNRLRANIDLHDTLHGFIQVGGGGATMEENMSQQLAGLCHEPIF